MRWEQRYSMQIERLPLDDALTIVPRAFADDRGYFLETFSSARYAECGVTDAFVQDNLSFSRRLVLRGLHGDRRMAKLVQVVAGRAFDVIVDLRPGSASYLKWFGIELCADEHRQVYVPPGFLHGFLALEDGTTFLYKQSALYDPAAEFGIAWNDPDIGIVWPLRGESPLLSDKDGRNPTVREISASL